MDKILVSPNPHLHSNTTTTVLMRDVVIALLPAVIVSVVFYGWKELLVLAVSVLSCMAIEYLITRFCLKKASTLGDWSAAVTGVLLALNLPPTTPWWVVFLGALVAIGVAKMTFGGLGQNVFNPALVGRVFLLISFPTYMTRWEIPQGLFGVDAISGVIYLVARKVIKPWITLSILGTVAAVSCIFWLANPAQFTDPLFNLLTGGLLLGSCFMATDYVTSPMSTKGGIIFGVGIGFITLMIRYFGSYPEGVSFAILIMNSTVPLLNKWFHQKKYGRA